MASELTATITDIQKFSVHDGPGIRSIVFFKGCPLRCEWCQNPETWSIKPEIMYTPSSCIQCGACQANCPIGAIRLEEDGIHLNYDLCKCCKICIKTCYAEALSVVGKKMNVEAVLQIVLQDLPFYEKSGGGVTLSGGEVLMHADFATELLHRLKEKNIHTAIETCGFGPWEKLQTILDYTDLVLYDIKHMDSNVHKKYTGQGNQQILRNLKNCNSLGKKIIIRMPYIPGVNDTEENLYKVGDLACKLNISMIHLLPFHKMGEGKWNGLGKNYPFSSVEMPSKESLKHAERLFESMGLSVNIGGYAVL